MTENVIMYGADWCRDCLRSKAQLDSLDVKYTYINLVDEPEQAEVAKGISGRTNIPVIVFSDGTHQV
ncbi:MAG: glutaredoxin, partial [Microbacteriaceae bacterium]